MTIRRSDLEALKSKKSRRKRQARADRELRLEQLEDRRVMAGLQLAGVLPNGGALLQEGDIRNVAPQELLLRFNDGAEIDPASLGGVEIIRSGGDGMFESAAVISDLNTNGAVVMQFSAVQPGQAGNGITISFDSTDLGPASSAPQIVAEGRLVSILYNTNPAATTTAFDVRRAIDVDPSVRSLIRGDVIRGNAFTRVGNRTINYSPLTLSGANSAKGFTNFGLGSQIQVQFTAVQGGQSGNGLRVTFSRFNAGGTAAPIVTVNDRTINVALNSSPGRESTVQDVLTAVNAHPTASTLVRASLTVGSAATRVGTAPNPPSVTLLGANDFTIDPGYIDVLDPGNQVVVRFQENLPDDTYLISVFGTGNEPLRTLDGEAFNDGESDFRLSFELDLAAQVVSVVPQPLTRNAAGALVQAREKIEVYFNDDDLDVASAERPDFYQLIFTNDTAENNDDVVFIPLTVDYDPAQDRAVLTFSNSLEALGVGEGTFRLRIGTDEAAPLEPVFFDPGVDVGSSFVGAFDLGANFDTGTALVVTGNGEAIRDGETVKIIDEANNQTTFEFDDAINGPFGVRPGNVAVAFVQTMSPEALAQALTVAINNVATLNVVASRDGRAITLTGDAEVALDPAMRGIQESTRGLILTGDITNVGQPYSLSLPGAGVSVESGHRDIIAQEAVEIFGDAPVQDHLNQAGDSTVGITTAFYNFQSVYGFDPLGNPLRNAITDVQKQRAREIFQIYGDTLGISFIESAASGITVVTGDLRAIAPGATNGPDGLLSLSDGDINTGRAVMDLQDYSNAGDDVYGGRWFLSAMHQIGHVLGLGHADELPAPNIMSSQTFLATPGSYEPVFPGDSDIVHGQHLYRPESKDIDLYKFEVVEPGLFSAETIAERAADPSQLDTVLTLYRQVGPDDFELVARNDNYFSEDSFLSVDLNPGTYFIGVSAGGNDQYDPAIEDSGFGGVSEGDYQLRLNFRAEVDNSIIDADNLNNPLAGQLSRETPLDGDADGVPGGVYNFWFRAASPGNTYYVDLWSAANPGQRRPVGSGIGSLSNPFSSISQALSAAQTNGVDIVRVVGNGGADGDVTTLDDNLAYEVGFSALSASTPLRDGSSINIPKGVTMMVDSSAMFKMRRARIGVGSSSTLVDRSASGLQVLGVPRLYNALGEVRLDEFGQPLQGSVIFTSLHDTLGVDQNPDQSPPAAREGDWGGLVFQSNLDKADAVRFDYEDEGIFLNYVNNAEIRYGGGNVVVDGVSQVVTPIQMIDSRPTVSFNHISLSADAAMSATPNAAEETNFHSPKYQLPGAFTSDYDRVGPDLHGNTLVENSLNGLFIRITTPAGNTTQKMTVTGRWDDADIVVVLQENLKIAGTPGGLILDSTPPGVTLTTLEVGASAAGALEPGTYSYRIVEVDPSGNEGPPSSVTRSLTLAAGERSIVLRNLPPAGFGFVGRRLYRSVNGGPFTLVTDLNASSTTYEDTGKVRGGVLVDTPLELRQRLDARLMVDPGVIVKLEGAMIEVEMGAQLIAEGRDGQEVVFTSLRDIRYGAGGTFNTNDQAANVAAERGNWAGVFVGPQSAISLDHAVVAYGGGVTRVDGGFRAFNPVEIHQSEARIANTLFENNADGILPGSLPDRTDSRFGRGFNDRATLFVRGSQPVLVGNTFLFNDVENAAAISIDVNSLNSTLVVDGGRTTGEADLYEHDLGNRGPLVVGNMMSRNGINGMVVRGGEVTTEVTFDDTDIVHVVLDEILVSNFHTFGGVRLESSPNESLVVKLRGSDAGFTASGDQLDIIDRIGGSVQILGQPGFPVVLTSLGDVSAGAGFDPYGSPQVDTANTGLVGQIEPTGNVDIDINFGPNILALPQALAAVNQAIGLWESFLEDPISVTFDFELAPLGGGILGGALADFASVDFELVRQAMIDDARPNETLVSEIPSLANINVTFPTDNNNPYSLDSNMSLTRANALALGIDPSLLPSNPSQYDPNEIRDADIRFANDLTLWDFDRSDGVNANQFDFVGVVIHEIGHALGFISAGDDVDRGVRNVQMQPLDFFRVAPGANRTGTFTSTPRILDPPQDQVFYDGGFFDPTGIPLPGLQIGDVPLSTGRATGDGNQASHWKDDALIGGIYLGMMDPTLAPGFEISMTPADMRAFDYIGWNVIFNPADSGGWRSVLLDAESNDRNAASINEREPADLVAPGSNGLPDNAQFLGALASNDKEGDDNLRLAFDVRGRLSSPADVDVYSFQAQAGTSVVFDIDRTSNALDTVLELVAADGTVLARSNDSGAESNDPSLLFRGPGVPAENINPMSFFDLYTTNPRDAGMTVRLPGAGSETNVYYVRVRSSSDNLANLAGGTTSGAYQMQLRLQSRDEIPGSVVSYADIRFAETGVQVIGVPAKSPLTGEVGEVENNDLIATSQPVGNLLETDLGAISIAGSLSAFNDADVYEFEVTYEQIATQPDPAFEGLVPITIDLDYADGLGRPNTIVTLYDSQGNVIATSNDSNIASDQPVPGLGNGLTDLTRGSVGELDPFIGPIMLPQGNYFVAITSEARIAGDLGQFDSANPPNPLVRLEPNTAIQRIAEDHVNQPNLFMTATRPTVPILVNATSPRPFHLGDSTIYVSRDNGFLTTEILTIDPFTGAIESRVGEFAADVGDIDFRDNENLHAFTLDLEQFPSSDDDTGHYLQISPEDATIIDLGDDGIQTFNEDLPDNPGQSIRSNLVGGNRIGYGIQFDALTYGFAGGVERGLAIGGRPPFNFSPGISYDTNILYEFAPDTGVAFSAPAPDRTGNALIQGAGTQIVERGHILTDADPFGELGKVIVAPKRRLPTR